MNWEDNMFVILMMIAASVLAALFLVVRVTFGKRSLKGGIFAMYAKALASLGFIMVGVFGIYQGVDNIQAAVIVLFGLIMGLVGDIVLDLKVVYDGREEEGTYLTGGIVSFAIGHIMFFIAILLFLADTQFIAGKLIGISVAVSVAFTALIMLVGKFVMKFDFGKFIIHSCIYAFMLTFMSAFTIALLIVMDTTIMLPFAIGMILFLLSDIVLTQMYFGGQKKNSILCIINHVLYYAAQISIASFICLM
ncbi:MAG: hypothetical protein GX242_04845 [Clostridiales bacterium]|nr:hypothetical protein [Clostridiales bacterium]